MKNAKQKAIEVAYGEYWEKVKYFVDENGWFENGHQEDRFIFTFGNSTIDFEYKQDTLLRPKSLSGIETNNNWISINSEDDLPNKSQDIYHVSKDKRVFNTVVKYGTLKKWWFENKISHYQKLEKKPKPIF